MKVKLKKLNSLAITPSYAKNGDACLDLVALNDGQFDPETLTITYNTGIAVEIPEGYVGLVFPRSSIYKNGGRQANSVGVIDSGYRGEIMVKYDLAPLNLAGVILDTVNPLIGKGVNVKNQYKQGDKIAQLMILPIPHIEFEEVKELSETERGTGGFGSTDAEQEPQTCGNCEPVCEQCKP